jgi:transmembrane sensor
MTDQPKPETGSTLRDQAVAWLVRVQSDAATEADWQALTAWLEASDANVAAFDAVETSAAMVDDLAPQLSERLAPDGAKVLPFAPRRPVRTWPRWAAIAAAAAAVVVAAPMGWRVWYGAPTVYQTGVGETRQVALADGTRIHLDSASKLTVRLGLRARRVEMAEAEASFDVAKDPGRPFLIDVADQQVRVVGTEFNIRNYDDTVVVSVRRGVVQVRQPAMPSTQVERLTAGDQLTHTAGAAGAIRSRVDPDTAFAWTQGRLICDDETLADIVAYLNRRYATPVRLSPSIGARRFSGVLELDDQAKLLDRLAAYMSLTVDRTGSEITLR